jgi:hypothetical protein
VGIGRAAGLTLPSRALCRRAYVARSGRPIASSKELHHRLELLIRASGPLAIALHRRPQPATKASDPHGCAAGGSTSPRSDVEDALSGLLTEPIRSSLLAHVLRQVARGSLNLAWRLVVMLLPQRMAVAIDETKAVSR